MKEVIRSAIVPYSARRMYELVNDVERYPEFLPWCRSTKVLSASEHEMHAVIELAKAGIHREFSTRNRLLPHREIELELVNGPFKSLDGIWRFDALSENACKISLDIRFEFANAVLSMMIGPVFNQVCETMVDAFVRRARQLHG